MSNYTITAMSTNNKTSIFYVKNNVYFMLNSPQNLEIINALKEKGKHIAKISKEFTNKETQEKSDYTLSFEIKGDNIVITDSRKGGFTENLNKLLELLNACQPQNKNSRITFE
jgi:phosphoribosylpyrophosphate synthetase